MEKLLSECEFNKSYTVIRIDADEKTKKRLSDIGLEPGEKILVQRKNYGGFGLLVKVMNVGFAIDKKIAEKVIVHD